MHLMLRGMVMDVLALLNLSSLSLLYRFVNVLYIWTPLLLLNTFCHAWSRLVSHFHELFYKFGFELYTVSVTLADVT